jgi:hypothetical protein
MPCDGAAALVDAEVEADKSDMPASLRADPQQICKRATAHVDYAQLKAVRFFVKKVENLKKDGNGNTDHVKTPSAA